MRLYGVTGWKNSGKTTLVERLVAEITGRGFTVSTLKHAHHSFDVDHPGKDSHRHRAAGASQVLVSSAARWALMTENRGGREPPLAELLARLDPVDLVLVEGYKRDRHPKIECRRLAQPGRPIAPDDPSIEAVATDAPIGPDGVADAGAIAVFRLDDVAGIADFILRRTGLPERREREAG
jgi:molybdopterin-guanine dinucleotide biosynthesis protein MobB